ncbi:hypothetical protein J6590_021598 [Homalodisca vitripennis]|nr:hypothetical protein J6590_021598 [Homalodisca vitripennis]
MIGTNKIVGLLHLYAVEEQDVIIYSTLTLNVSSEAVPRPSSTNPPILSRGSPMDFIPKGSRTAKCHHRPI